MKESVLKVLVPLLCIVAVLLGLEGIMRLAPPPPASPGFAYVKDAGIFYRTDQPGINAMGFVDKERSRPKPDGVFRILLLGDSFIDGTKVDVFMEQALQKALPGRAFEVIPMGLSGCGTLNELDFYERLGRAFSPDMVVVVVVPNDTANNSSVLEAVRLRFDPYHPGRNFAAKVADANGWRIEPIPPDNDFERRLLRELPPHPQQETLRLAGLFLDKTFEHSRLYQFFRERLLTSDTESLYHRFDGEYAYRLAQLATLPGLPEKLAGWNFPADLDMDGMFLADGTSLPPAFVDALDYTAYAFSRLKAVAEADQARLLVAFTDSCSYFPDSWLDQWRTAGEKAHRSINPGNFLRRVLPLVQDQGIDVTDMYPAFVAHGDLKTLHQPNDAHWSKAGRRLAGETLAAAVAARLAKEAGQPAGAASGTAN